MANLDFDVADFGRGPDDGTAEKRREDVGGEVGPRIATLHELQEARETLTCTQQSPPGPSETSSARAR